MTEPSSLTPLSKSPSPRVTMTNTALDCCIYDYRQKIVLYVATFIHLVILAVSFDNVSLSHRHRRRSRPSAVS